MYTPSYHREKDPQRTAQFMQAYPFATLVTNGDEQPVATHLPFIVKADAHGKDLQLRSHMARGNRHWQTAKDRTSLIIFQEPHAYISTEHYSNKQNVPTWDYIAVHVTGQLKLMHDPAELKPLMAETIRNFGSDQDWTDWQNLTQSTLDGLLNRIVGFEVSIQEVATRFKLSQEEPAADQERVRQYLQKSQNPQERDLGGWMEQ